jgi:hypothetical protein
MLSLSNVFRPLSVPDADTLIYIGPPPRAPSQSDGDYQYIEQVFSLLHRVHSRTLRDLHSSVFDKLLGPKSERTRRRFGKEGILNGTMTAGIKYFIDLRPAEADEEAMELIIDLTCSQGILNWYKAKTKYSIAPTMICGRDDFVSPIDQLRDTEMMKEDDLDGTESPVMPEEEYSPLRHRSAIERVIQAIGHNDPKLDSAPKMWNYFQVAKHLDVAKHERVSGWITKWLYSYPNSHFIQNNPEVVYRIALGIMSTNMMCTVYSMLVGEKALLDASTANLRPSPGKSVHGRPLEILDDDERNRIDHAAASQHARMKLRFEHLVDENMDWLKIGEEYARLMSLTPRNDIEKETISTTNTMIKDYVRGRILWVLGRNYISSHDEFDQAMVSCRDFRDDLPVSFSGVYGTFTEAQRLLTRTLWLSLQTEKIEGGECNAYTPVRGSTGVLYLQSVDAHNYNYLPICDDMIAREDRVPGSGVKILTHKDLSANIGKVNRIFASHFVEDQKLNSSTEEKESSNMALLTPPRGQHASLLDSKVEGSTPRNKHSLVELDSEDDSPLEMTVRPGMQPASDKRPRTTYEELAADFGEDHPQTTTLPLRGRVPDLLDDEIAVSQGGTGTSRVSDNANTKLAPSQENTTIAQTTQASGHKKVSFYEVFDSSDPTEKLNDDFHARSVAEQANAKTWTSAEGDVYMPAGMEDGSQNFVWVAKPTPFNMWDSTIIGDKTWREPEKEYWRATTCQLFCKLRDGAINIVREDFATVPTMAETATRILDDKQLQSYVLAYDTYARNLAEQLSLPYWTALSGEMYLRSPGGTLHADSNIWNPASTIFNTSTNIDIRYEGSMQVEYWRSPAGHLFRRRAGRIELYMGNKEETPPFNAASIRPGPLKMVTVSGMHKIPPHWHFANMPYSTPHQRAQPSPLPKDSPRSPRDTRPAQVVYPTIILKTMLLQFSDILSKLCEDILHPPHIYHGNDPIPRNLMDTLMCLTEDEWKYLPLWAGGNDDGTGGVFDEADVPNLPTGGFAGGKRGLGSDRVDGKRDGDWDDIGSEAVSTVGRASKLATDGETSTVKSLDTTSTEEFMPQDDVYRMLQDMNVAREESAGKRKEHEDEDQITVMGGASDIQGEMFGDIDDDRAIGGVDSDDEEEDFDFIDEE